MTRRKVLATLVPVMIVTALALGVAALAGVFEPTVSGPRPIVWDHETCAECGMHIGNPAYAAQIQTGEGRVLNFDDPGCLLLYVAREHPDAVAMYFHDVTRDRWLSRDQVAFVEQPADQTPMGWGLGAVARGQAGALTFEEASSYVLRRPKAQARP